MKPYGPQSVRTLERSQFELACGRNPPCTTNLMFFLGGLAHFFECYQVFGVVSQCVTRHMVCGLSGRVPPLIEIIVPHNTQNYMLIKSTMEDLVSAY